MKPTALAAHLSIPALLTIGSFIAASRYEPVTIGMITSLVLGGYLFYAAPHLLWALIAALAQFSKLLWHSGLVAASIALAAITLLSIFGGRDSSGLPMQWLLYWPLAVILQVAFAVVCAVYRWSHRATVSNPSSSGREGA